MDWINKFYSTTGKWWGPAEQKISPRDYQRLSNAKRLTNNHLKEVLELGVSYGNTAAVFAEDGLHVTAIEISDRIDFAENHKQREYKGSLAFIKEDFYKVKLLHQFDTVCYWNGFGIGTDEDQRKLLRKVAHEWLTQDGSLIMDVLNPFVWTKWDKDEEHKKANPERGYNFNVSQKIEFDPIQNRIYDTWWETDKPENKYTQTIRCYSPADLLLLVEGTGLKVIHMEVEGEIINWTKKIPSHHPIQKNHEYLVQIKIE